MADYGEYFDSDQDSNDHIDHIPKTPGPITLRDQESEDDHSDQESEKNVKEPAEDNEDSNASKENESGSDEDSNEEDNVKQQNQSDNSEVERSDDDEENEDDGEEEEAEGNQPEAAHHSDHEKESSADENEEKEKDEHSDDEVNQHSKQKSDDESKSEDEHLASDNESKSEKSDHEDQDRKSNQSSSPIEKRPRKIDSDSDDNFKEAKRLRIDDSDDEEKDNNDNEENNEHIDEDMEKSESDSKVANTTSAKDIFGDISSEEEDLNDKKEIKSDDEENEKNEADDSELKEEQSQQHQLSGIYMEEEIEEIPETRIDVEIPRIVANLGDEISFVKLPNFLSVDTHPYDPSWYEEEGLDDEEFGIDEEGRSRVKLKVENTIRWRHVVDEDGNLKRESNSRIVKWSDGSFSLHLGSETFDIYKNQLMVGDNNHLFIRQGTGLQGQAVFRNKLTFRPHSTDSFTHKKMTNSVADRNQRTQKIRVLPTVGKDPEAHRSEMIKKEEDKLKASIRRESKIRRTRERHNVRGPTASYLEPDDDEEEGAISLSAIKNKYKKGGVGYNVYTDSDETGDEKANKSEAKEDNNDEDDDSDLDLDKKRLSTEGKKRPVKIVDSDDDD